MSLIHRMISRWPRFQGAGRRMAAIASMRGRDSEAIRQFQLDRINMLWAHARQECPYYRDLAVRMTLPVQFATLEQFSAAMPVLERDTLRASGAALLSSRMAHGTWSQTGGSTGEPTPVYRDTEAHRWSLGSQYFHRNRLGVGVFDRTVMVWGHSASFAPGISGLVRRIRLPLEDWMRNRLRLSAYDLSEASLKRYTERLVKFQPALIYGYSSAVYLFGTAMTETARCSSLRGIVCTSEPLPDSLAEAIHSAVGIRPCLEYGSIEAGVMATSMPGEPLQAEEHAVWLETVRNPQGLYDIIVTSLWNRSQPLFRYRIGDCCAEPLVSGASGYRVLGPVLGRHNDNLVGLHGRVVHSEAVTHILKFYAGQIQRFTAVQDEAGEVTVHVEKVAGATVPLASLEHRFLELIGRPVAIVVSDSIPQVSASGKHRWIVSRYKGGGLPQ